MAEPTSASTSADDTEADRKAKNDERAADAGKWLSVLLAGFAAALTFLGIKGDEVGSILRNDRQGTLLVAALVVVALVLGTTAAFVKRRVRPWIAIASVALAVTAFIAVVAVIPAATQPAYGGTSNLSGAETKGSASASSADPNGPYPGLSARVRWKWEPIIGIVALIGAAAVIAFRWRPRGHARRSPQARQDLEGGDEAPTPRAAVALQPALLLSSLIVVTAAAFGGLMLESNSQYSTTRPQVDVSFAMTDDGSAVLATKVRASKLRAQDHLAMSVLGLPGTPDFACMPSAGQDGRQTTTGTPLDPCGQIPCVRRPCVFIAGALLRPDANGVIQHEFTVPIQSRQFLHLSVVAQLCPDQGACPVNQALATTVDFRIPQPSAAGDSTNDAESTLPVEAP